MNIVDRVRNIILKPKEEWLVIANENDNFGSIVRLYILPLAASAAIATFIGYTYIGVDAAFFKLKGFSWGISVAIIQFVSVSISFIVCTYVVDILSPYFNAEKNINRSAQLVAYSLTPGFVGGLLAVIPQLSWIGSLFGLYGIYLFYLGLGIVKNVSDDKKIVYMILTVVAFIVLYLLVGGTLGSLLSLERYR